MNIFKDYEHVENCDFLLVHNVMDEFFRINLVGKINIDNLNKFFSEKNPKLYHVSMTNLSKDDVLSIKNVPYIVKSCESKDGIHEYSAKLYYDGELIDSCVSDNENVLINSLIIKHINLFNNSLEADIASWKLDFINKIKNKTFIYIDLFGGFHDSIQPNPFSIFHDSKDFWIGYKGSYLTDLVKEYLDEESLGYLIVNYFDCLNSPNTDKLYLIKTSNSSNKNFFNDKNFDIMAYSFKELLQENFSYKS